MGWIKNIRLQLHHYFLQKKLKSLRRETRSVNWEDANTIGILFNATELNDRRTVLRYKEKLKNEGKQVKLLGYFNSEQSDPNFTFRHFNRKQIDWALRPSSPQIDEFMGFQFDLLLNLESRTRLHSEYIAALSKAHLKVGPVSRNTECYDLMIDASDHMNIDSFIKQIEALLKKTQSRNETANI